MTWAFLEDARDRMRRKVEPVTYFDIEIREADDAIRIAYKTGNDPVVALPWEAACARGDWYEADRIKTEMFAAIRRQSQLNYYEDLAWIDKSWLARKFLTLRARARTLRGR